MKKRLLSLILALCMVLSFAVPSFGAETVANGHTYNEIKNYQYYYGGFSIGGKDTWVDFYYSDEFFSRESTEYNQQLATFAMNCSAAYGQDWAIKRILGDGTTSYKGIGCTNFYENAEAASEADSANAIGIVIAKKELKQNGSSTGYMLLPVIIRGSCYVDEWIGNFNIGTQGESEGFRIAADKVESEIETYISSNADVKAALENDKLKFFITGHSRGGAVANLTAKRLVDKYNTNAVYAYTFEASQAGVRGNIAKESDYNCIHNIINYADIVPLLPPANAGFSFIRYGKDYNLIPKEKEQYVELSTKMKSHLEIISPGNNYDDDFAIASVNVTLNPFKIEIGPSSHNAKYSVNKEMGDWFRAATSRLVIWCMKTRCIYAGLPYIQNGKMYTSKEKAVMEIVNLVMKAMYKNEIDTDSMLAGLSRLAKNLNPGDITMALDIAQHWNSNNLLEIRGFKKEYYVRKLWNKLLSAGVFESFSEIDLAETKKAFPAALDLVIDFFYEDLHARAGKYGRKYGFGDIPNKATLLLTILYNGERLIYNHDTFVNLAWMRSFDELYDSEIN